jgi:hypothetical protein
MCVLSFFTHNLAFYKFPEIACQHRALRFLPTVPLSRINTARNLRRNVQLHRHKRRVHQSRQSCVTPYELMRFVLWNISAYETRLSLKILVYERKWRLRNIHQDWCIDISTAICKFGLYIISLTCFTLRGQHSWISKRFSNKNRF